ncbi:ADP-glyceromanno-heptose 6-epimerase [Patescibacteria group bacterium]|nr:ADP-glyceromanno-heptose 6-epimerase [Patescibacteria group bacterium]
MKHKKILITGGAGFIGSNLALTLQKKYPDNDYFVINNFSSANSNNLTEFKGKIISADISKLNLSQYFDKIDVIFHYAAITDTTLTDLNKMMSNNTEGFKKVLRFAIKSKAKLIYASSASVYGPSKNPMKVGENEIPTNIYAASKLVIDNIARKYFDTLPIIGLRCFNVYGPKEGYKGKNASIIWQLYSQMKEGKRPRVFKYGEQKRDHVYIKDVVKANLLAIECPKSGIFNVGSGKAVSFNEIIKILNEMLGTNLEPEYIDNPFKNYQEYTEADLTETNKILKYVPTYDIKKGIKDYLRNLTP